MRNFARHDAVVVGAGPGGSAAALALAHAGVDDVLVLEADRPRPKIGESVPPETRLVLQQLGVFSRFVEEGHEPCLGSRSIWGSDTVGHNDFIFNPHGTGWHLHRERFEAFLADEARAAGAVVQRGREVTGVADGDDHLLLELTGPGDTVETIAARFVVDATGARRLIARAMGATTYGHDRLMVAIRHLTFADDPPLTHQTLLEATEWGWWYAARLPEAQVVIAFATDADLLRELRLDDPAGWDRAVGATHHIRRLLHDRDADSSSILIRTAHSYRMRPVHGLRWLAVGDAATSFDPLSSQGVFKALANGLDGGRAVAAALGGQRSGLGEYERAVQDGFDQYLLVRNHFYDLERRWAHAPFWQRRRRRSATVAGATGAQPTRAGTRSRSCD